MHHVIASAQPAGLRSATTSARRAASASAASRRTSRASSTEPGIARWLPANSDIILQMHYTTIGEAATDRTSVGVIYAKEPPKQMLGGGSVMTLNFQIPPGADNHEVSRARTTLMRDTTLIAMMPHMHVRGKDMTYIAHYPDGRSETLLSCRSTTSTGSITYELAEPKLLPKGTRIEVIAHFDNSTKNLFNPDPTATVRWGDQTWEEMMIGFFTTLVDAPPPPDAATAVRGGSRQDRQLSSPSLPTPGGLTSSRVPQMPRRRVTDVRAADARSSRALLVRVEEVEHPRRGSARRRRCGRRRALRCTSRRCRAPSASPPSRASPGR